MNNQDRNGLRDTLVAFVPYILLMLAQLCWASNVVIGRAIRDEIPPFALTWWRWVAALAILLPLALPYVRKDYRMAFANWRLVSLLALLIVASNLLLYFAVQSTTAINSALMQAAIPGLVPIINWVLYRQRSSRLQVVGILVCIFGALLVLLRGSFQALLTLEFATGDLIMIVAVMIHSVYSVLLRSCPDMHPLSFLAFTFGIGTMLLTPFYVVELEVITYTIDWSLPLAANILTLAIFPSIVAYYCWNRGVHAVGANTASLYICMIPIFTGLLSYLFLDDQIQWFHFAGMALIFLGIGIYGRVWKTQ